MDLIKKTSSFKKLYLKRIATPIRISKKISDMNNRFNKIYKNFFLSTTDLKKQKKIEEFLKYQTKLKYKLQNFIKVTKVYFSEKINLKELYQNKSARFKDNNNIYFNIILNYDKKLNYQPFLFPIKKRDIIKQNCITELNVANIVKKIKSNNNSTFGNLFGNKKTMRASYLLKNKLKSKSALNIRKKKENGKNNIKIVLSKNFDKLNLDKKNKIIKKSLNIINKDNKNIVKAPNQFIKKKLVLIDKNIHHLHNLESIISPLTKPKEDNLNDNLTLNIKDNTNEQINININICEQNNSKINDKNKNIYDINTFHIMETKNLSNKSINSHSNSGNKEIIITPHPYSMKFSIESLGNMKDNFISLNNKKENSFNNKKNNIKNLYKKNSTFYEQNKNAFKLLPILNKNFNSTINNSDRINKNIKSFKKESKIRNKLSQRKTTKITKKFFDKIEIPTIRKTLRISKQRSWPKEVNKFIYKNKKGQIKFKFSYEKKSKSPLTFVEEYNRMRNRRKKNNKKITSNIGFRVCSKKEVKENKQKTYFGLTINNNKYY